MEDSIIIWNFLTKEYKNDHPVIYLYVTNNPRTSTTAVDTITDLVKKIFYPTMPEHLINITIKGFLEMKRKQYIKGEIIVKPIYSNQ